MSRFYLTNNKDLIYSIEFHVKLENEQFWIKRILLSIYILREYIEFTSIEFLVSDWFSVDVKGVIGYP